MILKLSAGEVLRIGDVATLTVLAIEGELIQLGLATAEGVRSTVGDGDTDSTAVSRRQRSNTWSLN